MENYVNKITEYLSHIEVFLTSVLLEETKVSVTNSKLLNAEDNFDQLSDEDIYLYTYDKLNNLDIIAILDKEWFGLLSSIMLGIEEKTFNDKTMDLLQKFSDELSTTFKTVLSDDGIDTEFDKIIPMKHSKVCLELHHTEYFVTKFEVEGLADENVNGMVLIGNPETFKKIEVQEEETISKIESDGFKETNGEEIGAISEDVLSGSYIEFEDFDEHAPLDILSENGKSMDMLRDVDLEVSVELGRIEMSLGRVLQLAKGSVIELDKLAGEPVDIIVNGQRIAQGEVVVIDEHFGVRISNLITTRQHLVKLN
jgi:flagellar motor switch protein FliN